MNRRDRRAACVAVLAAVTLAWALPAPLAAEGRPQPMRVRGTIEAVDGQTLAVKSREGRDLKFALADNTKVLLVAKADLAAIKAGTYVGTAAMPQTDGTLKAQEVLIFPEPMRGVGEGHTPWDLTPGSTMTNATVASEVAKVKDRILTLKYKDGEQTVVVSPGTPIVTLKPGARDMLKPGAHVFIVAAKQADGSLHAGFVAVGENGLVPPM